MAAQDEVQEEDDEEADFQGWTEVQDTHRETQCGGMDGSGPNLTCNASPAS